MTYEYDNKPDYLDVLLYTFRLRFTYSCNTRNRVRSSVYPFTHETYRIPYYTTTTTTSTIVPRYHVM